MANKTDSDRMCECVYYCTLYSSSGDLATKAVAHLYQLLVFSAQTGDTGHCLLQPEMHDERVASFALDAFKLI